MWIDMYPNCDNKTLLPKKANISALKPIKVQLRVIIFNTKDVKLVDHDFITQRYTSDIFVKGWLGDQTDKAQKTDTHNRSSNGEGNFNFRFIFDFDYSIAKRLIVTQRSGFFDYYQPVVESNPILHLELYDDVYVGSANLLGKLELNLLDLLPKAQKSSSCVLIKNNNQDKNEGNNDSSNNRRIINLFEIRKISGWWPFSSLDSATPKLTVSLLR